MRLNLFSGRNHVNSRQNLPIQNPNIRNDKLNISVTIRLT